LNWTLFAEEILRNYTREVYLATKIDGWDGRLSYLYDVIEEEEHVVVKSQWDFAASLLFAITVITTIGKPCKYIYDSKTKKCGKKQNWSERKARVTGVLFLGLFQNVTEGG